ncbi:MAG: tRNA uridine-5-carboxymethylaminomethyl(34) synthesis GTPase MnmE [Burkholderiaceae bacterium]
MQDRADAIAAIATAPGRGAIGIVRMSGKNLGRVIEGVCGRPLVPREATYLPFLDAQGQPIDHGLALYFPAPNSATGEDVLELQAHGGPVVLQLLLARCIEAGNGAGPAGRAAPRLRVARPGEFTERAFLNSKLDLAQAEAVADLIDASTEAAARSAARSMQGAFSAAVGALSDDLIALRMLVEAHLDFPEEDLDGRAAAPVQAPLAALRGDLAALKKRTQQGALLREGIQVVLVGQPNVGKSSLLNALAGAELAIVSAVAGTTRDKVAQSIQIEGVPLHVVDTAGLRPLDQVHDEVERIGIERTWAAIGAADAVVFLHDASRAHDSKYIALDADLTRAIARNGIKTLPILDIWNKSDLLAAPGPLTGGHAGLLISAQTGAGLAALRQSLLQLAGAEAASEDAFIARSRHVLALELAQQHLAQADSHGGQWPAHMELLAEELRLAHNALGEITGAFSADDLLGIIFSKFCIGK